MSERTESGLILPESKGGGLVVPLDAAVERLFREKEALERRCVQLEDALGAAATELELLRRRLGDAPSLPLPNRKTRRALDRKTRKAGRP